MCRRTVQAPVRRPSGGRAQPGRQPASHSAAGAYPELVGVVRPESLRSYSRWWWWPSAGRSSGLAEPLSHDKKPWAGPRCLCLGQPLDRLPGAPAGRKPPGPPRRWPWHWPRHRPRHWPPLHPAALLALARASGETPSRSSEARPGGTLLGPALHGQKRARRRGHVAQIVTLAVPGEGVVVGGSARAESANAHSCLAGVVARLLLLPPRPCRPCHRPG